MVELAAMVSAAAYQLILGFSACLGFVEGKLDSFQRSRVIDLALAFGLARPSIVQIWDFSTDGAIPASRPTPTQ